MPGRKVPRWAGLTAFWVGLLSVVLLGAEQAVEAAEGVLAALALPISMIGGFFAIVALVARIGRGYGFFGVVFALLGNAYIWAWLSELLA